MAVGQIELARQKLESLTELVKPWHENQAEWGFNEWSKAQTGEPSGRDWQTWSAAMYLYAATCVERECTSINTVGVRHISSDMLMPL
ncbi:MAG: hypothetical protein P1V20_03620 [Verrucomicrobiales bacterium]|nr:hypothetical protein [Verrucomicrobiales bacterium]